MTDITAKLVKELRDSTGTPMMTCKEALVATNGNIEEAIDWLRTKGAQIADKKSGRDANQGLIGVHIRKDEDGIVGALYEVNCETDFVAKNEIFQTFVSDVVRRATMAANASDEELTNLVSKLGENIKLGRKAVFNGGEVMCSYVHNKVADNLGSIGVLVALSGEPTEEMIALGNKIAMHIAAAKPKAITSDQLDQTFIAREKNIFMEQAAATGKPENIIEKMVEGKLRKVLREITLVDQPFVMDPDKTVGQVLKEHNTKIIGFERLEIGE